MSYYPSAISGGDNTLCISQQSFEMLQFGFFLFLCAIIKHLPGLQSSSWTRCMGKCWLHINNVKAVWNGDTRHGWVIFVLSYLYYHVFYLSLWTDKCSTYFFFFNCDLDIRTLPCFLIEVYILCIHMCQYPATPL